MLRLALLSIGLLFGCDALVLMPQQRPVIYTRGKAPLVVRMEQADWTKDEALGPAKPKPKITMEGIEAFRERQRLKKNGARISEWSQGADPADSYVPAPGSDKIGVYTPPTEEQRQAADELFGKVLRQNAPDDFGEGIENLDFGI